MREDEREKEREVVYLQRSLVRAPASLQRHLLLVVLEAPRVEGCGLEEVQSGIEPRLVHLGLRAVVHDAQEVVLVLIAGGIGHTVSLSQGKQGKQRKREGGRDGS